MKPVVKLAIITPIRDTPKDYFLDCIYSVVKLSNNLPIPFQWVIIIDGDTRAIKLWIEENVQGQKLDYKLLVSKDKIGLGAARNLGVDAADADYITWLDADDLLNTHEAISFFLKGINLLAYREDIALVYSDNIETDQFLKPIHIRQKSFFHKLHFGYRNKNIDPIFYVDFVYQSQILRKSDFINLGGFEEKNIGEDVELLLRIAACHQQKIFYHLPYSAYIYRHNPVGIVSTKYLKLRQLNCQTYLTYARKAKIHQSKRISFQVLFFDEHRSILNDVCKNHLFFNTFLPDNIDDLFYIQRSNNESRISLSIV